MRILVCASEAPLAPLNGMRLQLRALTEQLARRHEVCVLAFRWPGQSGAPPEGVELVELPAPVPGTAERLRSLVRREPVESSLLVPPMAAAVRRLRAGREFDVAHVTLGMLARVAPALAGLPALIAPLDAWERNLRAEMDGQRGATAVWRRVQLAAVERHVARAYRPFRRVVLVTEEDAAAVRAADPTLTTAVIPNGVDAAYFRPGPEGSRVPGMVLFTGVLATPANVQSAQRLAERVMPAVREREPDARLVLAGRQPSAAVAELPGAEIVADPDDLRPLLQTAAVYACPMQSGTGIKNKLLEAMACGAAAVATPLAVQGLDVRDGEQLLVADTDGALAAAVLRVLREPALRGRLGAAARRHVEQRHRWEAVAAAHEALYDEIA